MSAEDSGEMDFLESELSLMTIVEDEQEHVYTQVDPKFQDYQNKHSELRVDVPVEEKTLVVLSPLSAKHMFLRKWVPKRELASIVERPQRLLACSIGVAALYSLAPSHFHILKSKRRASLLSPHVVKIHGPNWAHRLESLCDNAEAKLNENRLEVPLDWPTGDIYLNPDTVEALEGVVGTIETSIDSLYKTNLKKAMIVVRPPGHHSHPCAPSGFCLINNAQITIQYAYETQHITHAVILDIDLHHGDGSQEICWKRGGWKIEYDDTDEGLFDTYFKKEPLDGPKVGYFSIHDVNSYPTELGMAYSDAIKNASTCIMNHDLCIWNVHLEQYQTLEEFQVLYETKYKTILRQAMKFLQNEKLRAGTQNFKPLILISAGFDGSEFETVKMQRHQVNLPTSFYRNFTLDLVKEFSIWPQSKFVSILEGGYSNEALSSGIFSHLMGFTGLKFDVSRYASKESVKELVRGCKSNWKPSSRGSSWSQEVIELGRSLLPEAIILDEKAPILDLPESSIIDRLRSSHKSPEPS